MIDITKETLENNDIEVIIKEQIGHKNLPAMTNKYDKIYKKGQI